MRLSARETVLGLGTLTVVLFGVTYLLGDAKLQEWKELGKARETVEREILVARRLIEQRPVREAQLDQGLENLRSYPEGEEVAPTLLRAVNQMASDSGLALTSVTPEREENVGGQLFEVTIKCGWQGGLEEVVRFLYALQSKGVMYDVESLQMQPTGRTGDLKGSVYVNCAYLRGAVPPPEEVEQAEAEQGLRVEPVPTDEEPAATP